MKFSYNFILNILVYISWNFEINMINKITQKHFEIIVTSVVKQINTLFWFFEVFEMKYFWYIFNTNLKIIV